MNRVFDRNIEIVLVASAVGKELNISSRDVYLEASVTKFMAQLKDETVVTLYNVDAHSFNELVLQKYDLVRIYAGYGDKRYLVSTNTILSISMDKGDLTTSKVIIICSSRFRAISQSSIKINQGSSLFSAITLLVRRMNIRAIIDPNLANRVLQNDLIVTFPDAAISQILRDYPFISVNNDVGGLGFDLEFKIIFNTTNTLIEIKPDNGTLIQDLYVNLNTGGIVSFKSLPVIPFRIGNLISINSQYFNQFISDADEFLEFRRLNNILDRGQKDDDGNNLFVIIQLNYELSLKDEFVVKVTGRPYFSFRQNIRGGL